MSTEARRRTGSDPLHFYVAGRDTFGTSGSICVAFLCFIFFCSPAAADHEGYWQSKTTKKREKQSETSANSLVSHSTSTISSPVGHSLCVNIAKVILSLTENHKRPKQPTNRQQSTKQNQTKKDKTKHKHQTKNNQHLQCAP